MSFMAPFSVSAGVRPVNSQPVPPKRKRLPNLSVQPTAPYRAPGVLVKGFGVVVGAIVGNAPYWGVGGDATPAVFVPSIHVQSLWAQSTMMLVMFAVTTP